MPPRNSALARSVTKLCDAGRLPLRCPYCHLRGHCLPSRLPPQELAELLEAPPGQLRLKHGEALYRAGEAFRSLYAVRRGFFKSYLITEEGRSQVTGFPMAGDIVGFDGIDTGVHTQSVLALEDGDLCVFHYPELEMGANRWPALQHQLNRLMGREIVREQGTMVFLGTLHAEERVAAFLLSLSARYVALGYSGSEFNLRMTREEAGSYLGLKLETVSRIMSRFQERGLITTRNRYVRIRDKVGLTELAGKSVIS